MGRSVRLNGMNSRAVYVDTFDVSFLEDHDINGTIATNIHMKNGRWTTVQHTADEVHALFNAPIATEAEDAEDKIQAERFRRRAKAKVLFQREMDLALQEARDAGFAMPKATSSRSEKFPDGSMTITLLYSPEDVEIREAALEEALANSKKEEE